MNSSFFSSSTYILKVYDLKAGMDLNAHRFPNLAAMNSLTCMLGSPYFVHMYGQGHVMKMLSDPEIVKDVHLYVSMEKAGDDVAPPSKQVDIAPSDHPNESVLLQEAGVYAEGKGAGQLTMKRPQRPLRRSKRLNVIQVTDQCDDDDGDCNNCEQFAPGHDQKHCTMNRVNITIEALAEKIIISRSLVKNSHNAGTKSFACWSEDMENLQSNANGISRLPILHGQRKAGDHDVNQLQIQQNSSSPQDLVIDSVLEVREMRDPTGESFSRQNRQGTRTEHPHLARSRKRHTSTIKAGSKVVLKTSTYPNKRNVAYGTIRSNDPRTKACGIELGAEFSLVRIDQPLLDNEELVREVSDCKTIGEAFSSGYLIAWPSAFIREKDN
ncbi:hypothetical protein D1007_00509 [Hordeum vulgare]|nr:hypothetical protein D1007_00509 [Hordeum vulgare]